MAVLLVAIAAVSVVEQFYPGATGSAVYAALSAVGTAVLSAVLVLLEEYLAPLTLAILPLIIVAIGFRVMFKGFRR